MPDKTPPEKATSATLNGKQKMFVSAYLANGFNATRAAESAGYAGNDNTLAVTAYNLLRNAKIRAIINEAFRSHSMSADEVLARLTDQARGEFGDGEEMPAADKFRIQQAALTALAKVYKLTSERIEIYDWRKEAQAAGVNADDLQNQFAAYIRAAFEAKSREENGQEG